MARILAAIVLVIAGSISLSAGALGLGEIDLKSALNQPFNAEIPVASDASGELDALHVEIASVDTFRQFGLDRAAFLSGFEFSVVDRANGAVVLITSAKPVVEPFVTLLLEVSWAQGRLLREYTVLLDPPVFATESVKPAVAAPAAEPMAATPMPREERVPVKSTGREPASAPAPQPQPVATPKSGREGGTFGPVQRNDTLWAISGRLVSDTPSVSRNQMMLAIYQANPEAFTGNINRLKAGMILRVPSADEFALGAREATSEVRRQNEQWRGASARREEPQGGRLQLVPPPDRDSEAAAPGAETGSGATGTALADAERDTLQGQVADLENQLADSRRQLQVRDQELEALQRQLAQIADRPDASQPDAGPVIDDPDLVAEFDGDTVPGEDAVESGEAAADADQPDAAVPDVAPPADVTPAQPARSDESFVGALFTNPLVYISLAVVLLLAWLFARNRSKSADAAATGRWDALDDDSLNEEEHEATTRLRAQPPQDETFVVEEALPSELTDEGSVAPFTDASSEDWGGLVEESETPLERTISTDSAVNLDQADPIAESDFHMAYGLYDQAADLLTRAVEIEPERKDLRMKLLEVFFIWENKDGFLQEAVALQERIDATSDPDWNKVLIMGKQICPDEELFAGAAAPVSPTDSVDLEFGEDGGSDAIDFSLDEGAGSVDLQLDEEAADLDLDLSGDDHAVGEDVLDFDIGGEDEATQIVGNDDLDVSGDAPTMETPTIETPAMGGDSTMETPTIESPAIGGDSTMETPTIETPTIESPAVDSESTMETPTIETPVAGELDDDPEAGSDQTAEIDLDDLDLDLTGLDDIGAEALDADSDTVDVEAGVTDEDSPFAVDTLEFDAPGDDTQQRPAASLDDIPGDVSALDELADGDVESTAEMRNLDAPATGDTLEQPSVGGGGDTAEQPNLAVSDDDTMLDIGEPVVDDAPTEEVGDAGGETGGGVDGATMTEVGTKLDLARAYIDMGDPDGARSILNEVLEEADSEQKQEAQKLLDDLAD